MSKTVPISKVRPTYSSIRTVKFTNIDHEDFIHKLGGKAFKFKAGVTIMLAETYGYHFARNLAHKIIFRDDASLKKYAGIDNKLSKEKAARGETPLIKGVGQGAVDNLIELILNGHKLEQVEDTGAPIDASELGTVVTGWKQQEDEPKTDKKRGRPPKAKVEEKKEEKKEEFPGLNE